jgi:hypothetical protein
MMITEPALLCLVSSWQRLLGRASDGQDDALDAATRYGRRPVAAPRARRLEGTLPVAQAAPLAPERGGPIASPVVEEPPLTTNERRARAAAVRAFALSRGRRFDAAKAAFAEAARLDPLLDLTRTPMFWRLERAAHEAAIAAYVDAGRERDAAVLRAQVQSTFRPKRLKARPGPATIT